MRGRGIRTLRVKVTYANVMATLAVVLAAGGGAFAVAQTGNSGTLGACVKKKGGAMRMASKCRKNERRVTWNQAGVRGSAGQPGAAGQRGTNGTNGTNGTDGTNGKT